MPWSGASGSQTFSRTDGTRNGETVWQQAQAADVLVNAPDHDTHDEDIADGIDACLKKDGGNKPTANIDWGGYRITNLNDPSTDQDAATKKYVDDLRPPLPSETRPSTVREGMLWSKSVSGSLYDLMYFDGTDDIRLARVDASNNRADVTPYKGADIASAATTDIGAATGELVHVTGTTTITSLGTAAQAGVRRTVIFDGALTLTHGANLVLPGADDITTAAGDVAVFRADTPTKWVCESYTVAAQAPTSSPMGGLRNLIVNGDFRFNQRAYVSGTALGAGVYAHDRWKAGSGGGAYTYTSAIEGYQITITSGSFVQVVEAANVAGGTYTLSWTGTAQARVQGGSYGNSPITVTGVAGGGIISVEFAPGTVGEVQLEAGDRATAFERRPLGIETALCERYYEKGERSVFSADVSNGGRYYKINRFRVRKRTAPTMSITHLSSSGFPASASTASEISADGFTLYRDCNAGTVAGYYYDSWVANAEL